MPKESIFANTTKRENYHAPGFEARKPREGWGRRDIPQQYANSEWGKKTGAMMMSPEDFKEHDEAVTKE